MFSGAIEKQHQVVMGETCKANLGITIYKRAHITVEPKRLLVLQYVFFVCITVSSKIFPH